MGEYACGVGAERLSYVRPLHCSVRKLILAHALPSALANRSHERGRLMKEFPFSEMKGFSDARLWYAFVSCDMVNG
jgi:hypothetical protein